MSIIEPVICFDRLACDIPVCIQTSNESRLLCISVWINAGSVYDPVGKDGLAHLCEHLLLHPLMNNDTRAYRIQHKSGAMVNAYTDAEWVVISAQVPFEQARHMVELLSILLSDPYCEANGMRMEKEAILNELRDNQPVLQEEIATIFKESAFAHNQQTLPNGGTAATLKAIKTIDVQNYYSRYLTASRMMITVHGNTDTEDLMVMLDKAFGGFFNTDFARTELGSSNQFIPTYHPVIIRQDKLGAGPYSSCGLLAGFGSVARMSEEYWIALAFEVLMADGPESLLYQWFRTQYNLSYGAVSMTEAFSNWGCQYFMMNISANRIEETLEYLHKQWRTLPEWLTEEEMNALRNRFVCRALSSLSENQDRMVLLRDFLIKETTRNGTFEGGIEAIIDAHARKLTTCKIQSYIQKYAQWDRLSLICVPLT